MSTCHMHSPYYPSVLDFLLLQQNGSLTKLQHQFQYILGELSLM